MKQGWSTAVVAAVVAVAVFITAWVLWPRPATVTAPARNIEAGPAAVPPNTVPPNTVVVSAADASERINQEVTALAGTA